MGKQWSNTAQGVEGCLVLYNLPDQESSGIGHAFLSIPGRALANIEARDVWRICSGLVNIWKFKPTRCDIALDDFSKSITFEQIQAALDNKNYKKFRKHKVTTSCNGKSAKKGWCFELGRRSANRCLRIYEKEIESKGKIKSVRLESELHDEIAEAFLADWLSIQPKEFEEFSPKYLAAIVTGSVDFIDATADRNLTRCPHLDWWQRLIDKVGGCIRHSFEPLPTSYERKREWFTNQVSRTLASFRKIMGKADFRQYLNRELELAEERFNNHHRAFIDLHARDRKDDNLDYLWAGAV